MRVTHLMMGILLLGVTGPVRAGTRPGPRRKPRLEKVIDCGGIIPLGINARGELAALLEQEEDILCPNFGFGTFGEIKSAGFPCVSRLGSDDPSRDDADLQVQVNKLLANPVFVEALEKSGYRRVGGFRCGAGPNRPVAPSSVGPVFQGTSKLTRRVFFQVGISKEPRKSALLASNGPRVTGPLAFFNDELEDVDAVVNRGRQIWVVMGNQFGVFETIALTQKEVEKALHKPLLEATSIQEAVRKAKAGKPGTFRIGPLTLLTLPGFLQENLEHHVLVHAKDPARPQVIVWVDVSRIKDRLRRLKVGDTVYFTVSGKGENAPDETSACWGDGPACESFVATALDVTGPTLDRGYRWIEYAGKRPLKELRGQGVILRDFRISKISELYEDGCGNAVITLGGRKIKGCFPLLEYGSGPYSRSFLRGYVIKSGPNDDCFVYAERGLESLPSGDLVPTPQVPGHEIAFQVLSPALRLRSAPTAESKVLTKLELGAWLYPLHEVSEKRERFTLNAPGPKRGSRITWTVESPWIRVRDRRGFEGWVFAGGLTPPFLVDARDAVEQPGLHLFGVDDGGRLVLGQLVCHGRCKYVLAAGERVASFGEEAGPLIELDAAHTRVPPPGLLDSGHPEAKRLRKLGVRRRWDLRVDYTAERDVTASNIMEQNGKRTGVVTLTHRANDKVFWQLPTPQGPQLVALRRILRIPGVPRPSAIVCRAENRQKTAAPPPWVFDDAPGRVPCRLASAAEKRFVDAPQIDF